MNSILVNKLSSVLPTNNDRKSDKKSQVSAKQQNRSNKINNQALPNFDFASEILGANRMQGKRVGLHSNLKKLREQNIMLDSPNLAELESLIPLVPKLKGKLSAIREFSDTLAENEPETDEEMQKILQRFAEANFSDSIEGYLGLSLVLEQLRKKKKSKWLERLEKVLASIRKNNYNEILTYFSTTIDNISQDEEVNAQERQAVTKLKADAMSFDTIHDVVNFIEEYLHDDFTQMLSFYLKAKAHKMAYLQKEQNFESKSEISNIISSEYKILNLNSLYANLDKLRTHAKKQRDINTMGSNAVYVRSILDIFESGFVTEISISNLSFKCISGMLNIEQSHYLVSKLKVLLDNLPLAIFNYNEEMVESLKSSFNQLLVDKDNELNNLNKSWFEKAVVKNSALVKWKV